MKVTRVLNNNVVLGSEDDVTYLLMGLSIGFKKKIGDWVPSDSIEKLFILTNPQSENRLQEMIGFIPEEYFRFATDALLYIKKSLKREFSDSLSLFILANGSDYLFQARITDHFYMLFRRVLYIADQQLII